MLNRSEFNCCWLSWPSRQRPEDPMWYQMLLAKSVQSVVMREAEDGERKIERIVTPKIGVVED